MNIILHLAVTLISLQLNTGILANQLPMQDPVVIVDVNQVFGVAEGESVTLKDTEILFQVVKVSDSRCPKGVNCIRAGEIEVEIMIIKEDEAFKFTLRNPTWERGGTSEAKLDDGLVIKLNGAFSESTRQKGDPLEVSFVFTNDKVKVDSPKSH